MQPLSLDDTSQGYGVSVAPVHTAHQSSNPIWTGPLDVPKSDKCEQVLNDVLSYAVLLCILMIGSFR